MGDLDLNLILQLAILIVGIIAAILAKKGLIDRKTIEDTKDIANAATAGIDKLKDLDASKAKEVIDDVLEHIGEKKPILDAFLKSVNLNPPKGGDDEEGDGG